MKISSLKDLRSVSEKFYKFINSLSDPFSQRDPAKMLGLFSFRSRLSRNLLFSGLLAGPLKAWNLSVF